MFRLGDIATVTRGFKDPTDYILRQRRRRRLAVGVVMLKGANIVQLGDDMKKAVDEFVSTVPQGIDFEQIANQPKVVEHAVGEFLRSFLEALVIVLFVSFVSLGLRTGVVVALSVPLVLTIVFIVMYAIGSICIASRSAR